MFKIDPNPKIKQINLFLVYRVFLLKKKLWFLIFLVFVQFGLVYT